MNIESGENLSLILPSPKLSCSQCQSRKVIRTRVRLDGSVRWLRFLRRKHGSIHQKLLFEEIFPERHCISANMYVQGVHCHNVCYSKKKKSETTLSAHYQECCSINYGVICLLCSTKQLLKNESYIIHVLTEHEGWGWRGAMNHIAKQYMSDFMWIKRVCAPTYLYQAFLKDRKKH